MATTGLWPVKTRLKEVIAYADNPDKTANPKYADNDLYSVIRYAENGDKTDKQLFISSINCPRQRAYECMMTTKRRFGKTGGIAAYHGFQSFRQGEVTPEEAYQIGIETAKRMWGDKYEVIFDTKEQITAFENERSKADNIRRRAHNPDEVKAAKDKRKAITEKIDPLRKKLKHAEKIMERSPHLYELLQQEHSLEKTAMRKFEKSTGSLNKTNA